MSDGFDINKSKISDAQLATFLASEIDENLRTVPGIGKEAERLLALECEGEPAITTTHQLIGRFLTLRGVGMTSVQHLDAFWFYLKLRGIKSYRSGIVHAIGEKINLMIPGTFSLDTIQEDEEEYDSLPDYESS